MIRLRQWKTKFAARVGAFRSDEQGATAIEYGLAVALISLAIVAAVTTTGANIKATFSSIQSSLANTGK